MAESRIRLIVSVDAYAEIRRLVALTNAGLIDDRVPEIEMDGITLTTSPDVHVRQVDDRN